MQCLFFFVAKMAKLLALAACLLLAALCLSDAPDASAQPTTIVVPDNYSSLSQAIANAKDGDTIFVKAGTYNESSMIIGKSINLVGEDRNKTIINFYSTSHTIVARI